MAVSLKPSAWGRYKDIAWFLAKYGASTWCVRGLDGVLAGASAGCRRRAPDSGGPGRRPRKAGTDVHQGQLLSTRPDPLLPPYLEALARLIDQVGPFPYEEVEGRPRRARRAPVQAFEFDLQPLAAASLGYVHRARLRHGRPVAVKVQGPRIRDGVIMDRVLQEIAGMSWIATQATGRRYRFEDLPEEFRPRLLHELDYRQEASHLSLLGEPRTSTGSSPGRSTTPPRAYSIQWTTSRARTSPS